MECVDVLVVCLGNIIIFGLMYGLQLIELGVGNKTIYTKGFWIVEILMTFILLYMKLSALIILQIDILIVMSYMDYKTKMVYRGCVYIYGVLSVIVCISNYGKGITSGWLGIIFFMFSVIKIYAVADGIVMFGIVQSIACYSENYVVYSIICFFMNQILISIHYVIRCLYIRVCTQKKITSHDKLIPVLPYILITFAVWLLSKLLFGF